jgi:hypothetical protein
MRKTGSELRSEAPPPAPAVPAGRRWRSVAIALGIVGLLVAVAVFAFDAMFGRTTVIVANVDERPVEGIVLLAVSEGMDVVRCEWPIGTLLAGETREIRYLGSPDTNLAVRIRAADGTFVDDRLRIYLGSPSTQHVWVDVTTSGVRRARHQGRVGEEWVDEPTRIHARPMPVR